MLKIYNWLLIAGFIINQDRNDSGYSKYAWAVNVATDTVPVKTTRDGVPDLFIRAELLPRFIKGDSAMVAFFNRHLVFPNFDSIDCEKAFTDTVLLKFVVAPDNRMSRIMILCGKTVSAKAEAARLIMQSSSSWIPALQGGTPVKAYVKIVFIFKQFYKNGVCKKTLVVERWPY